MSRGNISKFRPHYRRRCAIIRSAMLCIALISTSQPVSAQSNVKPSHAEKKDATSERRATDQSSASYDATKANRKIVREGISVQLDIEPMTSQKKAASSIQEGDDVTVRFTLNYTSAGTPLTGVRPAAWMDSRPQGQQSDCAKKISTFLSASLTYRPAIDFNSYYVLALNNDSTITVVDPLFHFGGTKLLALVALKSPGEDWALTSDQSKMFVSLPDSGEVALVDTTSWKVATSISVASRPARLALQPDEQNLWVTYNATASDGPVSGVAVISAADNKTVAQIRTGRGRHDIAFSDDSRFAFITNKDEGTVSIVDARSFKKLADVKVGIKPVSIAFSSQAKFAYVASEDGQIVGVDPARLKTVATMQVHAGLEQVRFSPGGRFGFVANPAKNLVYIFDASINRIIQVADVQNRPDQLAFTNTHAYVRSRESELVYMIPLDQVGVPGRPLALVDFPGGQAPLGKTSRPSSADTIVKAPDADAVLVANAADKTIYYYKEGMAAPMGNFSNYRREPRAIAVVDRSLKERAPGVYETTVKLPRAAAYDLAFLLDSPRIYHCFDVTVSADPKLEEARKAGAIKIEPMVSSRKVKVGESVRVRFKLSDPATNQIKRASDVHTLVFLAPGVWQNRQWAKEVSDGVYEMEFTPPQSGVYYVFLGSASLGLTFNNNQFLVLEAQKEP